MERMRGERGEGADGGDGGMLTLEFGKHAGDGAGAAAAGHGDFEFVGVVRHVLFRVCLCCVGFVFVDGWAIRGADGRWRWR